VAVARTRQELQIFGVDQESTEFLVHNTSLLADQRQFPEATITHHPLSWTVHMQAQVPVPRRFGRATLQSVPLQFDMDLRDVPGSWADSQPTGQVDRARLFGDDDSDQASATPDEDEFIEHLAASDGLLLLFDPIREWNAGDTFRYLYGPLLKIAERRMGRGPIGAKLPHYVAVCITKFDHPDVYRRARQGYCTVSGDDPYLFPRIADDMAERFFADLCHEADLGNAELVAGTLRQYFRPERVKYFVTSAIGFYVDKNASRFKEQDYQNTVPVPLEESAKNGDREAKQKWCVRGPIYPINVIEPLIWLGQSLATEG
jgi:hypothetical protein